MSNSFSRRSWLARYFRGRHIGNARRHLLSSAPVRRHESQFPEPERVADNE